MCGEIDFRVSPYPHPALICCSTALSLAPAEPRPSLSPRPQLTASSLQLDRKLKLLVPPKTLIALKHLRAQLSLVVATRMRGKEMSGVQAEWWALAMEMLGREKMVEGE